MHRQESAANGRGRAMKLTPFLLAPLFALMSCQHKEDSQRTAAAPTLPSAALAGPVEAGHPVIVRLVGRTKTMTVTATAKGPAYSVVGASGEHLLTQGTLDDLRRQHPDLYRQDQYRQDHCCLCHQQQGCLGHRCRSTYPPRIAHSRKPLKSLQSVRRALTFL